MHLPVPWSLTRQCSALFLFKASCASKNKHGSSVLSSHRQEGGNLKKQRPSMRLDLVALRPRKRT